MTINPLWIKPMFTGIIEEIGEVIHIKKMADGREITIAASQVIPKLKVHDSIAIDGVCQTVIRMDQREFTVQAVGETLRKTTLGEYKIGRKVNLETSLTLETPLGGHLVLGHVNGTARIQRLDKRAENYYLEIHLPTEFVRYCIPEGSIAIDGISLTIANLEGNLIGISIIPYTAQHTTLREKQTGNLVNIEVDIIPRYLEKLLLHSAPNSLTYEKIKDWGY